MSQVRFGKLARFYIENMSKEENIDEFVEQNGISYQSRLMAEKFANLYVDKFIKLPLETIETFTLNKAEEVMMSAQEDKNQKRRFKMSEALELDINRSEQDPTKIEAKGTKLLGRRGDENNTGIRGVKQAKDLIRLQAKNNNLKLDVVKDGDTVTKYVINDPEKKINAKSLYFAVKGIVKIADKYNDAKSDFYDLKKQGANDADINAKEQEYLRLKIALNYEENLDKLEKWINDMSQKNPDQADALNAHFDSYVAEINELESIGYVQIDKETGIVRMTDNDHRNMLVSKADKDVDFLVAGHEKILAEQALREQKANGTAQQRDPFKETEPKEQPRQRASWRDSVGGGETKQGNNRSNRSR
jgi:hypothetical protein